MPWITDEENEVERARQQKVIEKLKKRDNFVANVKIVLTFLLILIMAILWILLFSSL